MKSWIPRVPLVLGACFGLASWAIVIAYGRNPSFGLELAWIHALALGSFTTISLSVLVHALPNFTDLPWRGERIARIAALLLPLGAVPFVSGFAFDWTAGVAIFGVFCALVILLYLGPVAFTLVRRPDDPTDAAIARAFGFVFVFLFAAVAIALSLAPAYAGIDVPALRFAPSHAVLAIGGWLTLLTMGVSARTMRPMLGTASRLRAAHIASNTLVLIAVISAAVATAAGAWRVVPICFALGALGSVLYAVDGFDRLARATTPHRPVHAFVALSFVWLCIAASAAAFGRYDLAIVLALAGWIGQMVNAHLHHIGVRVLLTSIAGEDNETRPWQVLDVRVEWLTFVATQLAVVALTFSAYVTAGILGLLGVAFFAANLAVAAQRVRRLHHV